MPTKVCGVEADVAEVAVDQRVDHVTTDGTVTGYKGNIGP
jgi:hypothetical protein